MIADHIAKVSAAIQELAHFSIPQIGTFESQFIAPTKDENRGIETPGYHILTFVPYANPKVANFSRWLESKYNLTATQALNKTDEIGTALLDYLKQFKELDIEPHGKLKLVTVLAGETIQFEKKRRAASFDLDAKTLAYPERKASPKAQFTDVKDILGEAKHIPIDSNDHWGFASKKSDSSPDSDTKPEPSQNSLPTNQKKKKFVIYHSLLTVFLGLIVLVSLIALGYYRKDINAALGLGDKPTYVQHSDIDNLMQEALEGDSLFEVQPVTVPSNKSPQLIEDSLIGTEIQDTTPKNESTDPEDINHPAENNRISYHIIIGGAESFSDAEKIRSSWRDKGFETSSLPPEGEENRYRISVFSHKKLAVLEAKIEELKKNKKIPSDSWVLKVQK